MQKSFSSLYGNNGMEPQLRGSYLLTHGLSHELWLQLDMKMNGHLAQHPHQTCPLLLGASYH